MNLARSTRFEISGIASDAEVEMGGVYKLRSATISAPAPPMYPARVPSLAATFDERARPLRALDFSRPDMHLSSRPPRSQVSIRRSHSGVALRSGPVTFGILQPSNVNEEAVACFTQQRTSCAVPLLLSSQPSPTALQLAPAAEGTQRSCAHLGNRLDRPLNARRKLARLQLPLHVLPREQPGTDLREDYCKLGRGAKSLTGRSEGQSQE